MEDQEVMAYAGNKTSVYVVLRISTNRTSPVAITVGISDQATDEDIRKVVEQCKRTMEELCEEYNRLDTLVPPTKGNE
jgi:hypothetical protein